MFNIICHNCPLNKISPDDHTKDEFDENHKYYQILDNIIRIGNDSFIGNKYMCSYLKIIILWKILKYLSIASNRIWFLRLKIV